MSIIYINTRLKYRKGRANVSVGRGQRLADVSTFLAPFLPATQEREEEDEIV